VETLVAEKYGDNDLKQKKIKKELAQIIKELGYTPHMPMSAGWLPESVLPGQFSRDVR
jgi:hypothetical protein